MIMMLGPNKTAVAKLEKSEKAKSKGQDNGKPNPESAVTETRKEHETQEEPQTQEEPETAPLMVDTWVLRPADASDVDLSKNESGPLFDKCTYS